MNIELRNRIYYATLLVPVDVRGILGRFRFKQTLGTSNKQKALLLAAPYIAMWKDQIKQARGQSGLSKEAEQWQQHFRMQWAIPSQSEDGYDAGLAELQSRLADRSTQIEVEEGTEAAESFHGLVIGTRHPSNAHYEVWKAQLDLAPKTIDQMTKDVSLLVKRFTTLQGITKQSLKKWMDDLKEKGVSQSSQKRIIGFCNNYWKYLKEQDVIPAESDPFKGLLAISKGNKKNTKESWVPLAPEDVVTIWKAATTKKNDPQLADLIYMASYTGARIEELCSLKVENITKDALRIVDAKTDAGVREVPIHSALVDLVKKLKKESKDGYLLSGLTFNKYGDRSNAIGKRFGLLKTSMGYGRGQVFHSIRKTLTTLLENAGVSENLAADIVGHEKPRITYGLYSGGASLDVKKKAIEKVAYPF